MSRPTSVRRDIVGECSASSLVPRLAGLRTVLFLTVLAVGPAAHAWHQWGGPNRDFVAATKAITWGSGPKTLWTRALGDGYSGVVTDGGVLYTMYRPVKGIGTVVWEKFAGATHPEVVVAIDAASGRTLWEHSYDAPPLPKMNLEYGPGPHSTPLVHGGMVYAVGATGRLHALDAKTGHVLWARDLWGGLKGQVQGRGYSASPLLLADTIVLPVGGRGQALVAFDRKDGHVAWKGYDLDVSPSSPITITVDGQPQIVFFHADGVAGLDPAGKAVLWNHPHKTDWGLNIAMPVWLDGNRLFVSSAYSGTSRLLQLARSGGTWTATQLWEQNKLRVHHGNAIRLGERIYGSSGDFGPSFVTAVDLATGRVAFQERGFAKATFVRVGDVLLLLDEEGTLAFVKPGPGGLAVLGKASVLDGRSWTVPTVVGTTVYVRDRTSLKALQFG